MNSLVMLRRAVLLDSWGPKPEVGKNVRMKSKKINISSLVFSPRNFVIKGELMGWKPTRVN